MRLSTLPEDRRLPATSARRVYHVTYPCSVRGRRGELAKHRDAASFCQLLGCAQARGYVFDSFIFNYASEPSLPAVEPGLDFLRPEDLLMLTTRPPLHDDVRPSRKHVPQSGSRFERRIFDAIGGYLSICSRTHVRLQPGLVQGRERRQGAGIHAMGADFTFCQNCDARLRAWTTLAARERARRLRHHSDYRSLGWFIHIPQVEGIGCGLIVSFGMGSFENLVWSRIVRTRFDRWFDAPVFAMAEMDLNKVPADPATLHFADDIPVRVLMEVKGGLVGLGA